jgi:hypothetical protein
VTYVVDPSQDTVATSPTDHAYWLSGLTVRTAGSTGKVDAFSYAAGLGDPTPLPEALSAGTLNGGSHGPLPYTRRTLARGPAPVQAKADRIDVTVTDLATATIEPVRAGVDCNAQIEVTSDGPFELTLAGCNRVIHAE